MRHVAAYIVAVIGGNANPSEKDLKKILNSVGIEPVDAQLTTVVNELNGKDLFQLMEQGSALLAGMPMGGGGGASGSAAAVDVAEAEEAPKEEAKKPESSDESDSDMGMGLFD